MNLEPYKYCWLADGSSWGHTLCIWSSRVGPELRESKVSSSCWWIYGQFLLCMLTVHLDGTVPGFEYHSPYHKLLSKLLEEWDFQWAHLIRPIKSMISIIHKLLFAFGASRDSMKLNTTTQNGSDNFHGLSRQLFTDDRSVHSVVGTNSFSFLVSSRDTVQCAHTQHIGQTCGASTSTSYFIIPFSPHWRRGHGIHWSNFNSENFILWHVTSMTLWHPSDDTLSI